MNWLERRNAAEAKREMTRDLERHVSQERKPSIMTDHLTLDPDFAEDLLNFCQDHPKHADPAVSAYHCAAVTLALTQDLAVARSFLYHVAARMPVDNPGHA